MSRLVISAVEELLRTRGVKTCVTSSIRGGLITGLSATVGGLLGGTVGIFAGATLGGLYASKSSDPNMVPVWEVIRQLTTEEQDDLVRRLQAALIPQNADFVELQLLAGFIAGNPTGQITDQVLNIVKDYLRNQRGITF